MNTIYVIGSSNTDMVVQCKKLPRPGETVLGGEFFRANGGKGANQAVAAARLGGKVTFVCHVGDDAFGRESLEAYKREDIDVSRITVDPGGPSGVALILVGEGGENMIAVASGVNAKVSPENVEFLHEVLTPGDIVLMQLEIPVETVMYAARIGREKDAVVILDPAPAPPEGMPETIYPLLNYILPNQHEATMLLGSEDEPAKMAQEFHKRGVRHAIITLGDEGVVLSAELGDFELPSHYVTAVDATAAGDAFAGALAVALAEEYKTREAIAFAQIAAALSVTRRGAQPSLPKREEVEKLFVNNTFTEPH
ncbi:MAG: ribokinase [Candidatus Omnitrophica bacterium]|nr:ribokinase [Candidatus Omnitrophota bacterium]